MAIVTRFRYSKFGLCILDSDFDIIMRFLLFSFKKFTLVFGHFGHYGVTKMQPRDLKKARYSLGEKISYVELQVKFLHVFSFLLIIF